MDGPSGSHVSIGAAAVAAGALAVATFSIGARLGTEPRASLAAPTEPPTASAMQLVETTLVEPTPALAQERASRPATPGLAIREVLAIASNQLPASTTEIESVHLVPFVESGLYSGVIEPGRWIWLITARVVSPGGPAEPASRIIERVAVDYPTGEILATGFQLSAGQG